MVTDRQRAVLKWIKRAIEDRQGTPPSYQEIADGVGIKSKSGVHEIVLKLEERGYIRRLPNRARAIEIIRMP
jgi:repressor LexA